VLIAVSRRVFIKLGAIGDVVMAMTAAQFALKKDRSSISWIIGKQALPLLRRVLPEIETIVVDEVQLLKSGVLASVLEVARANRRLAFRSFDQVVSGYRDSRYRLLAMSCHSSAVTREFAPRVGQYHADAYYELLSGQKLESSESPLHPASLIPAPDSRGTGIVLAPGGAKNLLRDDALRRYPIEHYVTLAKVGFEQGKSVTIMGAPSDEWVRPYFSGLPVRFELGTVPLEEVPFWLQQFERLITHDSGPMHLGFMSGIPVTAFFGPTRAEEKVPPNYARNESQVIQGGQGLTCAPCYDGRNYANCSHQKCLTDLVPSRYFLG
jgi:heptosyltransferase-2